MAGDRRGGRDVIGAESRALTNRRLGWGILPAVLLAALMIPARGLAQGPTIEG